MSLTAAETRIKAKLPLKVKRFYLNMTQMQLSNLTGINTARISMFETGQLILNEREKMKISTVMGKIDWEATENQKHGLDDFAMPREEAIGEAQTGIKVQICKNPDVLPNPKILHIAAEEDSSKFKYLSWDEFLKQST